MGGRILLLVVCAASLAGCGLVPPAVSVASFAVDAFSYVVSGKSVSDHGLSLVAQEDCAILNLVQGEAVCAPGPHPEIQMGPPRDPDARLLLASRGTGPSPVETREQAPLWARVANALPVEYAAAGPLVREPALIPATLTMEPLTSGPIGLVATSTGEPAA